MQPSRPRIPLRRRIALGILARLERIGVTVQPFLTVRRAQSPAPPASFAEDLRFGFLDEDDIRDLVRLEPGIDPEPLRDWFRDGRLCFGVRDGSELVARMWCDLAATKEALRLYVELFGRWRTTVTPRRYD